MANRVKLNPVTNYLKNVSKSMSYAAADIGKDLMPNVGEFTNSNKDFLKATYATLKNPKATLRKSVSIIQNSKIYQALDYGVKNTFEDLRTGNFYNMERINRDEIKLAGLGIDDMDDLSEFGIDDDWESNINKKSVKKNEITDGDIKIIDAVEGSSAANASATVNAVIKASDYQVKSSRTNFSQIYMQNERLFGGLHKDISVVGATVDSIHKITSASLQNMDKNMSDFFTAELKLSQERNAMLKEMLEIQRNMYTSAANKEKAENDKSKAKAKKNRWSDIQFNGIADFESYFEVIKKNVDNTIAGLGIPSFNENSNMLATMMVSPLKGITHAMINAVIPATLKAASKEFDNMVSGIFGHGMARLANAKSSGENSIFGFLSKIFGINSSVNFSIDTSKYEKGPVPFDGITRKAIIDVIPTYLRRIEAHITGRPEQTFNYSTGKWTNMQAIKKELDDLKKNMYHNATSNIRELMRPGIEKTKQSNKYDRESFEKALEEFWQYLTDRRGIFNPNVSPEKNNISASKYPALYKNYEIIRTLFSTAGYTEVADTKSGKVKKFNRGYDTKIKLSSDVFEAIDSTEKAVRNLEETSTVMQQYFAAMGIDSHGKWNKEKTKFSATNNVLMTKDKIGNTVFDYLRNINTELMWWRTSGFEDLYSNIASINFGSGGGRGKGTKKRKNSNSNRNLLSHQQLITQLRNAAGRKSYDQIFNSGDLENSEYKKEKEAKRKKIDDTDEEAKRKILKLIDEGKAIDTSVLNNEQIVEYITALVAEENSSSYVNELHGYDEKIFKSLRAKNIKSYEEVREFQKKQEKEKEKEDKEDTEDKKESFINKALNKIKQGAGIGAGIVSATGDVVANMLRSANKAIYEMMYKAEVEDKDEEDGTKKKYTGFMDMLKHKITNTFDGVKKYFKDNIISPIKNWLGLDKKDVKDKFITELKDVGKNIWKNFVGANKDLWGPVLSQTAKNLGLKNGQTIAEKNRANDRKSILNHMDEVSKITSIYDPNFVKLMREYKLDPLNYGTDFESAVKDIQKEIRKRYLSATNNLTEASDSNEYDTNFSYLSQSSSKDIKEIANKFGIDTTNLSDSDIVNKIRQISMQSKYKNAIENNSINDLIDFFNTNTNINNRIRDLEKILKIHNDSTKSSISSKDFKIKNKLVGSIMNQKSIKLNITNSQKHQIIDALTGSKGKKSDKDIENIVKELGFTGTKTDKIAAIQEMDPSFTYDELNNYSENNLNIMYLTLLRRIHNFAKGTVNNKNIFATGPALLSRGEYVIDKTTGKTGIVNKTDLYNLGDSGTAIMRNPNSGTTIRGDSDKERLVGKKYGIPGYADGTADSKVDKVTVNGNKLSAKSILDETKKNLPEGAAGGLIGGLLLSLVGLPLTGMVIGAGSSIIKHSDKLSEQLFGKKNEKGERDDSGAIKKSVVDAAKKYAPDMFKYGLAGIIPGLLVGLGPIPGLLVGSTIGFLRNNENFTNRYFGENGKFSIKSKEKQILQDLAPGAAKGALGGVLAHALLIPKLLPGLSLGGLGLVGSLLIGSGIGMAMSTEEFKNAVLGIPDKDGNREGGLLGAVKDSFAPLADAAVEFKDKLLTTLDKNIMEPLSQFAQPFIHELPRIAGWLPSKINDILENHFGRSLSGLFKDFIGNPIAGIVSKVAAPLANTALNIVTSPVKLFGFAGKKIRKNQIKENRADYMTAKERIEWSMENNGQVSSFDKAMAGIGSGVEGSLSLDQAKNLRDTLNTLNDTKASLALNKRKTKGDINNILDSIKGANGEELSKADKKNVRKALQAGNASAAKQILMQNNFTESMLNNIFSDQGMGLDRKMKNYIDINAREKALGNISEGDKSSAKDSANTILKKLGIDNINLNDSKSVDRLLANLNTEIEDREINGNENVIEPIEKVGLTAEKINESIKMINKTIIDLYTGNTESLKTTEAKVKADLDAANAKSQEDINKRKDQYTDLMGRTKYTEQENDLINKIKEDNKDGSAKTENEIEDIIKEHTLGSMYQIKRDKNGNAVRDKNGKIEIERHGSKGQQEKIIRDLGLQHMYQVEKDEKGNIIRDNEGNLQIMKDEKGKLLINEDNKNAIDYATAEDNKSTFQRFSENTFDTLVNGTVETVGNVGAGALGAVGNILSGTAKGTAGVINAGTNLVGGLVGLIPTKFTRNAGRAIKEAGNAVYQSAENVNKDTSDFIDNKQKNWSNLLRKGRVGFNKVLRTKIGSPELNGVIKMNEKFGSFISKLVNEDAKKAQNLSRLYEIDAWYEVNEDSARIIMNLSNEQWKNICKFLKNKDVIDFIKASRKRKFPLYETSLYPNNMKYLTSLSPAELVKLKNCCSYNIRIFADKDYGRKSISDDFGNSFKNVYEKTTIEMKKKEAEKKKQKDVDEATNNPTPPESQPVPPTPDTDDTDTDDVTSAAGGTIPGYGIGTAILSGIADIGGMAFQGAKIVGRGLWEGTKAVGKLAWNGAKALGKAAWNGTKALGKKAIGAVGNGVKAVGNKVNDMTGGLLKKAVDGIGKGASNIFNGIKNSAGKLKKVDKIGPGPNDYGIVIEKGDGSFEPDTSDSKTREVLNRATKAEKEESEAAKAQIKMEEQMNKITAEPTKKEPGLLGKLLGLGVKAAIIAPFIKPLIENVLKPLWDNAIVPLWKSTIKPGIITLWEELIRPALGWAWDDVVKPGFNWLLNTGFPWIVQNILSPLGKIIVDAVHNKIADDWGMITHQPESNKYADPETGFTEEEKNLATKNEYTDNMIKKQYLNRITSAMSAVYTSGTSSFDSRLTLIQNSIRRIREAYKDGGASSTEIAEYIKQYQQNDYKGNFDELPTIIDGIIRGDNDSINKFAQAMDSSITNKDVANNASIARGVTSYAASIIPAALFGPIGGLAAGALTYNAVDDSRWKDSGKITGEFKQDDDLLTDLTNGSSAAEEDVNTSTDTDAGSGSGSNKPLSKYGRFKGSVFGLLGSKFDNVMRTIQINRVNERTKELEKKIEEKTGKPIEQVYEEYELPKNDDYISSKKSIGFRYNRFSLQNLASVDVPVNNNINNTLETIEKAKAGTISIFSSNYWTNNDDDDNIIAKAYNNAMKVMAIPSIVIRDAMRTFLSDSYNIANQFKNSKSSYTSPITNTNNLGDSSAGLQLNWSINNNSLLKRAAQTAVGAVKQLMTGGKGKYGKGIYSKQIDPLVSKIRYNANGDSEYQTIGDSGCGPAAAVNAIESMYGRSKNLINAAKFALKGGYKERNGGTRPEFFKNYFASRGYASQTTTNRNTLINNIRAGIPTVLMGQDKHGVSDSTPYGRNSHYVTATGVDSKGRVIIQDPESRYDNQLYSMNDVMRKTSFGVSAFGRGKYNKEVWWYLRNKMGLSEAGAAGVIANMEDESGVDPGVVSDYVKMAQGYTNESFTQGVNDGTISKDTFVNANLDTINPDLDSYGYGLVQWYAKDRKQALYERTVEKKIPINDLVGQLDFINYETTKERVSRYANMINILRTTNDPAEAASIFNEDFEVSGVAPISRQNKARKIYEELKGTEGTPISGSTYNGVSATATNTSLTSNNTQNTTSSNNGIFNMLRSYLNNSRAGRVFNSLLGSGNGKEGQDISSTSTASSILSSLTSNNNSSNNTQNTTSSNNGIFNMLRSYLNNSRAGRVFNSLLGTSDSNVVSSPTIGGNTAVSINNGTLNTSGNARAVVENALNEIGYVADPTGTKHNKYNAWWNSGAYNGEEKGITAANGPAVDWCANFVSWVMRHSGVDKSVAPSNACVNYDEYYNAGAKPVNGSNLLPGDILFENRGDHIGIVAGYKDGKVYTIEGNGRYSGGNYDGTTVDFKSSQSPTDYYLRPNYTTDGSDLSVDQIIEIGKQKEEAIPSGLGGNTFKPLSKYGRFKNSINKKSYQEIQNDLYQLRKNNYKHKQLMKKQSVYGMGTSTVIDNSALINTIIKILYTIADNTDKLNLIVSILNSKLGTEITASDVNSKTKNKTLKQKLMQSLNTPNLITATSKLNGYVDNINDNGINNIISAMNAIASE